MNYVFVAVAASFLLWLPSLFSVSSNLVADAFGTPPSVSARNAHDELSLREQLGQLVIIGIEGTSVTEETRLLMKEVKPGGVLLLARNIESAEQLTSLIKGLQAVSSFPLFVAVDQEGQALARISFAKTPHDLERLGVTMNLAPVLDSRTKGDFVYPRSLRGENIAELARVFLESHRERGVVAVPKHFPGYDGVSFNPEGGVIPQVPSFPDTSLFSEVHARTPFLFLMLSHVVYEEVDANDPLPFSGQGMEAVRELFGEDVLLMSDDLLSKSMLQNYPLADIGEKAVVAGVDALLAAGYPDTSTIPELYQGLLRAARRDLQLQASIERSSQRILQFKEAWFSLPRAVK